MRKKRQRRGPQGVSRIPIRKLKKKNSKTALEVEVLALLAGRRTPLSLTALWQKLRLPPKEEQLLQVLRERRETMASIKEKKAMCWQNLLVNFGLFWI